MMKYAIQPGGSTIHRMRTRVGLQPSQSAMPPQTPAMILCSRERYRAILSTSSPAAPGGARRLDQDAAGGASSAPRRGAADGASRPPAAAVAAPAGPGIRTGGVLRSRRVRAAAPRDDDAGLAGPA